MKKLFPGLLGLLIFVSFTFAQNLSLSNGPSRRQQLSAYKAGQTDRMVINGTSINGSIIIIQNMALAITWKPILLIRKVI